MEIITQTPKETDAFSLGREAYDRGDNLDQNPYDESDAQHDEWEDGYFLEAIYDCV